MTAQHVPNLFHGMAISTKGDRTRASIAALKLAELGGFGDCEIEFISSPKHRESLEASMRDDLWDGLEAALDGAAFGLSEQDLIWDEIGAQLGDLLAGAHFDAALGGSLRDLPWVAYYTYCIDERGLEVPKKLAEKLALYLEIAETCFAIWIAPGKIYICDKPREVAIKDSLVINMVWHAKCNSLRVGCTQ